jgi:hypothetical protein
MSISHLRPAALFVLAFTNKLLERLAPPKPKLGVVASLDGISEGQVYGWAFDRDHPQQPLHVTVMVNHHPVTRVAAVHYRPDVAQLLQCSGQYGFYVDLADHLKQEGDALIDVRLDNGWPLEGAPRVFQFPAIRKRAERPTVLFMHIAKTAGTAFREAITANYLESEIAYLYPGPPGFLVPDLRALPLEQRRAYRLVVGHYQFGMHWALPQSGEYITIVREPTARLLSGYRYLKQHRPHLLAKNGDGLLTMEEFLQERLNEDFDNTMVRCFSGVDPSACPPGAITREVFEQAVENLRTSFRFVGHQEQARTAYDWLRNYYGWHATETLSFVNRGEVQMPLSEDLLATLRRTNQWDYRLYEEIQRVFPGRD